jgi:hypothetical protein
MITGTCVVQYYVGIPGFEPGTSSLSVKRSNQLSYIPLLGRLETTGTSRFLPIETGIDGWPVVEI